MRSSEEFRCWLQLMHCTDLLSQCPSIWYRVWSLELGLGMRMSLEVVEHRVLGGVLQDYGVVVMLA